MSKACMRGVVLVCTLCLAGAASMGDVTAGAGPGTSIGTYHEYDPGVSGWHVNGGNTSPMYVWIDPAAGAWEKTLNLPVTTVPARPMLSEHLQVKGSAWSDWHEEIVTPGWKWEEAVIYLEDGSGGVITPPGLTTTISLNGKVISFEFDPVPVGSNFQIEKWLIFEAGDFPTESAIVVREYPTPEPASLAILSAGGVLLILCRRRRK